MRYRWILIGLGAAMVAEGATFTALTDHASVACDSLVAIEAALPAEATPGFADFHNMALRVASRSVDLDRLLRACREQGVILTSSLDVIDAVQLARPLAGEAVWLGTQPGFVFAELKRWVEPRLDPSLPSYVVLRLNKEKTLQSKQWIVGLLSYLHRWHRSQRQADRNVFLVWLD